MAKDMTTKKTTDVALGIDFAADAGEGMENTDRDAFAIPFIRVLQKMSPAVDEIDGARPGQIMNTVTNELFDELTFIPCAFRRTFIAWGERDYHGEYTPEEVAEMRSDGRAQDVEGEGLMTGSDRLTDTRSHYGLIVSSAGAVQQVVLALSSTQIKKSKQLMSMLSAVRINGQLPPTWMSKIKVTTVLEKNDQGSWHGVRFEPDGFIDSKELYEAGKAFHDVVMEGNVRVARDESSDKF